MFTKLLDTLRAVLHRRHFESELDAELADHIAKYTDDLVAQGVSHDEAQQRAQREFGFMERIKDEVRDSHAVSSVDSASRHLRFAIRALRRNPVFSLTAIGTLALGISATTAGFSVVNAVLLRELPYPNADRLYRLFTVSSSGTPTGGVDPHDFPSLVKDHPGAEAAAFGFAEAGGFIDPQGNPYRLTQYHASPQFFKVFDVPMFLGERFKPEFGPGQVILSHATWQNIFASDPNVVGKWVIAGDPQFGPSQVVGVASPSFNIPAQAAYWSYFDQPGFFVNRGFDGYILLRQGVTLAQFEDQLKVLSDQLGPDPRSTRNLQFVTRPMLETMVGNLRLTSLILFGASSILLLIACINVANLVLARGIQRTREMALREALGAKRGHIVRTLWTEAILLSIVGGVAGLALGVSGVRLLMLAAPEGLPRLDSIPLDSRVVLFGLAATVVTALLTGLAPAVRISRADLRSLLNDGARGSSGAAQQRTFGTLVITEIALAVVLVTAAGLLMRSYVKLVTLDPGFNSERLMAITMQVNTPTFRNEFDPQEGMHVIPTSTYEPVVQFYEELMERIRGIPGVAQVTAGVVPLHGNQSAGPRASIQLMDRPLNDSKGALPYVVQGNAHFDFFQVIGARIVAGRSLEKTDRQNSPGAILVNETFVKRFLPGENPLGVRMRFPNRFFKPGTVGYWAGEVVPEEVEIVGVVADIKQTTMAEPVQPTIYHPMDQFPTRTAAILVRSASAPPETLIPAIRTEIREMDKTLGATFTTYPTYLRASVARERMGTTLLTVFSGIALLLAAVGIYGLMSYSVAQRMQEMAVRAAMGASGNDLRGMIVRRGLQLGLVGTALGVAGAAALHNVVAGELFEVSALDLSVFLTVPVVLLSVAVLSSYIPALRAARTDPAVMLRMD